MRIPPTAGLVANAFFKVCRFIAGIAQLVERNLAKVEVAGPNPVSRSRNAEVEALE